MYFCHCFDTTEAIVFKFQPLQGGTRVDMSLMLSSVMWYFRQQDQVILGIL